MRLRGFEFERLRAAGAPHAMDVGPRNSGGDPRCRSQASSAAFANAESQMLGTRSGQPHAECGLLTVFDARCSAAPKAGTPNRRTREVSDDR